MTIKRRIVKATLGALTALVVAAGPAKLDAQVLYGNLVGTVTDDSGAGVPGATVTATNKETNYVRTVVSGDTGTYSFTNLQAGTYDVKVSLQGFKESVKTDVPVSVNEVAMAHSTEVTVKPTTDSNSSRLRPTRSASQPLIGKAMAEETM